MALAGWSRIVFLLVVGWKRASQRNTACLSSVSWIFLVDCEFFPGDCSGMDNAARMDNEFQYFVAVFFPRRFSWTLLVIENRSQDYYGRGSQLCHAF